MNTERKSYIAYMVRLWRVDQMPFAGEAASWRASLESPQTGEQIGFGSLQGVLAFLQQEVWRCEQEIAEKQGSR